MTLNELLRLNPPPVRVKFSHIEGDRPWFMVLGVAGGRAYGYDSSFEPMSAPLSSHHVLAPLTRKLWRHRDFGTLVHAIVPKGPEAEWEAITIENLSEIDG